ncbi:MAG: hypothetical protein ACRC3Y_01075, partial [Romboutsia sp.]|uniref:hypothetical protein n=1 Tax=Romboutsia sp. TaxID=1965302 RepID=UPI003F2D19E4
MKIFKEILDNHTNICILKDTYIMDKDIEITVNQEDNKVVIWAFNDKTNRFVNLGTKRFEKLIEGFRDVASDLYSSDYKYYITLIPMDNRAANKSPELEVEELKKRVACLNDIIARLEGSNKKLLSDVDRYRKDYLYYHGKWAELVDENFKRTMEELNGIKKNSFMHNARGAG